MTNKWSDNWNADLHLTLKCFDFNVDWKTYNLTAWHDKKICFFRFFFFLLMLCKRLKESPSRVYVLFSHQGLDRLESSSFQHSSHSREEEKNVELQSKSWKKNCKMGQASVMRDVILLSMCTQIDIDMNSIAIYNISFCFSKREWTSTQSPSMTKPIQDGIA